MKMTFSDIFKSSFLNNVTAVSPLDMVLALGLSFCLGLFIFYVYSVCLLRRLYGASARL